MTVEQLRKLLEDMAPDAPVLLFDDKCSEFAAIGPRAILKWDVVINDKGDVSIPNPAADDDEKELPLEDVKFKEVTALVLDYRGLFG